MMKQTTKAVCLCMMMAGAVFADGVDDALVSFSTRGPDRYADGSTVMDGECYALVWSADGVFEGLSADGAPLDANDRIVLIAPIAKDARCPEVLFQIPASMASTLASGVYDVLLLDTRVSGASGVAAPRGTVNGRLSVVNGYGAVTDGLSVARSSSGALNLGTEATVAESRIAATGAAAPAGVKQPRIKHIRLDGDNVFLTVENLPGFMRVQSGATISADSAVGAATATGGDADEVVLVTPKTGSSGFFRVVRN